MTERRHDPGGLRPSVRHARRDRAAWWGGMLVSVVLHALAFLSWRTDVPLTGPSRSGDRPPVVQAGGGALRAYRVQRPRQREIPPPPRPILSVEVPEMQVEDVPVELAGGDLLPVARTASLPGIGGGPGQGQGGSGDDYTSPVPRSVLPHWDPPGSVRGMEVTVRVFVDEHGRPTGLVELHPPTPDDGFNREIRDRIRRMEYRPASRGGTPVAGWAEITFIF